MNHFRKIQQLLDKGKSIRLETKSGSDYFINNLMLISFFIKSWEIPWIKN
jgi:hypothetical protein